MPEGLILETGRYLHGVVPLDINGAGGNGPYVSYQFTRRLDIVILSGAWAGGTSAVTISQAKDNAGGSAKALPFGYYWLYSKTVDAPVRTVVASNTFNVSVANSVHVIPINNYDLDIANGFNHLRIELATPGGNADLACAFYVFYEAFLQGNPKDLPSYLT